MLVTILTVSYNAEKTIQRTIESVLNQTYQNIEYIIIDGKSKDKTVEVAKRYQKVFDDTPGRRLIIISEPDEGMYDGLNKGARIAHGELIGQINADDWYESDAVETMAGLYKIKKYDVAWGSIRIKKSLEIWLNMHTLGSCGQPAAGAIQACSVGVRFFLSSHMHWNRCMTTLITLRLSIKLGRRLLRLIKSSVTFPLERAVKVLKKV